MANYFELNETGPQEATQTSKHSTEQPSNPQLVLQTPNSLKTMAKGLQTVKLITIIFPLIR